MARRAVPRRRGTQHQDACPRPLVILAFLVLAWLPKSQAIEQGSVSFSSSGEPGAAGAMPARRSIQAVPDKSLTTTGQETGCEHYRNGYLGLAMCVNYYDTLKDDTPYVQVVGSITNEGSVDICNLTLSVEHLSEATVVTPAWLPAYPRDKSFKAGTYFPFSAIIPASANATEDGHSYPAVDIYRSFYACDSSLKALPEDQVVPPPGAHLPDEEEQEVRTPSKMPSTSDSTFGTKIKWAEFIKAAGAGKDCVTACVATLNQATEDCAAVAYVIQSGCAAKCPEAVAAWAKDSCKSAGCSSDQCHPRTSSPAARRSSTAFSTILLTAVYTALFVIKAFL